MVRLTTLTIKNFRGIKSLPLTFGGASAAILGPNGCGKSSVADAIDFLLTSRIRRLTGTGAGALKLSEHGHHVDASASDGWVEAIFEPADGGKPATLKRSLDNHGLLEGKTFPELDAFLSVAAESGAHLLTRREILQFIVTEPSERSKQVASVLQIGEIDAWRKVFDGAARDAKAALTTAKGIVEQYEKNLLTCVDPPASDRTELLNRLNTHRSILGGSTIDTLDDDVTGNLPALPSVHGHPLSQPRARDLLAQLDAWLNTELPRLEKAGRTYRDAVAELQQTPGLADSTAVVDLVQRGVGLVQSSSCPLCEKAWDSEAALRGFLNDRLAATQELSDVLQALRKEHDEGLSRLAATNAAAESLARILEGTDERAANILSAYAEGLDAAFATMYPDPVTSPDGLPVHQNLIWSDVKQLVARLSHTAQELESPEGMEKTAEELRSAAQSLREIGDAETSRKEAQALSDQLAAASRLFIKARDDVLSETWEKISTRFSELYRKVHSDDEGAFRAELEPTKAGLVLEVDFYDRGRYPPGALHSEGHQDSMGVFLFLALSEYLGEGRLPIVVLDDVLMSVDQGHRRAVAEMLQDQFTDTQFIITTHDRVWWRQLRSVGAVSGKNAVEIRGWSLEDGPYIATGTGDMFVDSEKALTLGHVAQAAHALRHTIEAFMPEVCQGLGAKVRLRGDGALYSGELVDAAKSRFTEIVKKARTSDRSWGKDTATWDEFDARKATIYGRVGRENWAINAMVHSNPWADLEPADFRAVLAAYREFFDLFKCKVCDSFLWLTETPTGSTGLRCSCGAVSWNLVEKGK